MRTALSRTDDRLERLPSRTASAPFTYTVPVLNSRHEPGLVMVAALMILLAGCSPPTAESAKPSTAAPSSPPTESPNPPPTPTATPSPSFDAADPSTWLITEAGIGRAEIGLESAADALSPSFVQVDWCEGLEYYDASGPSPVGFGVIVHPGSLGVGGIGIRVRGDIPVTGPVAGSPVTESGIGLGSTLDELVAAEPDGAFETAEEWPDYVVNAGSHWIMFEVSEAEPFVRGITVTEEVPPAGYCG